MAAMYKLKPDCWIRLKSVVSVEVVSWGADRFQMDVVVLNARHQVEFSTYTRASRAAEDLLSSIEVGT